MKVAVFWVCISAVVGAATWTVADAVSTKDAGKRKTAERILHAREVRGLGKFVLDAESAKGDIWCPSGTGSVMFSGTEKNGRTYRGAVCTSRGEGIVVVVE